MEDFLDTYLGSAESYLNPTEELKARSLAGLKTFFGFYKKVAKDLEEFETRPGCRHISTGPLPELYTEGLDNDQIWEQIQLVNQPVIKGLKSVVANIAAKVDRGEFTLQTNSDSSGGNIKVSNNEELDDQRQNSLNEEVDDEISCDFGVSDEECLERRPDLVKISAGRKSVVDDKFFRLSEMEKFLEMVEKEEAEPDRSESDEDVNYFEDAPSLSDGEEQSRDRDLQYEDFFDPPEDEVAVRTRKSRNKSHTKTVRFEDVQRTRGDGEDSGEDNVNEAASNREEGKEDEEEKEEEEEEEEEGEEDEFSMEEDEMGKEMQKSLDSDGNENVDNLSTHQKKQLLLKQKIMRLEELNIRDKGWQMSGEVLAKKRPINSLLEEDLSFDHMSRPPPVVTEDTTKSLEDIIKQRITDEAWDDVVRRFKPVEKPYDYSRSRPLDQEKSKLSLAEIYEQEYIKQTQDDGEQKEDERHIEIREMMDKLFVKLDALSNFHFTPKPPKPEVKIVTNIPVIQMEEVAPVTTSDATLLAPEEIQAKSKRPQVGPTEKTSTDRKRERRLKKKQKRLKMAEKKKRDRIVAKLNPGLGNKYTRQSLEKRLKAREESELVDKSIRSSSRFFARLQEEVKEQVRSSKAAAERTASKRGRTSVQQYKL